MIIQPFVLTLFQENTRVVACETTGTAICIDPGEGSEALASYIERSGFSLQTIALTHGHLDHIGGTAYLSERFPSAEIVLHQDDEDLYYGLPKQPMMIGIQPHQLAAVGLEFSEPPPLTRNWEHGEEFVVGELRFDVLHCPGHTRGHVVLAERTQKAVFVGDCLFAGSIGRTDLPGGDYDQLIDSIKTNILTLGDDFTVYSGHGPETTVGNERQTNPFLTGAYNIGSGRFV